MSVLHALTKSSAEVESNIIAQYALVRNVQGLSNVEDSERVMESMELRSCQGPSQSPICFSGAPPPNLNILFEFKLDDKCYIELTDVGCFLANNVANTVDTIGLSRAFPFIPTKTESDTLISIPLHLFFPLNMTGNPPSVKQSSRYPTTCSLSSSNDNTVPSERMYSAILSHRHHK